MDESKSNTVEVPNEQSNKITNFAIFGERCSGTNLLQNLMEENFEIENTLKFSKIVIDVIRRSVTKAPLITRLCH